MICPNCGCPLTLHKARQRSHPVAHQTKTYNATWTGDNAAALTHVPDPGLLRRETPIREPSVEGAVTVPLLQALVSGCLSVATSCGLWLAFGWPKPVAFAAFVGIVVMVWVWADGLRIGRKLVWLVEEYIGEDVNQDGEVGQPDPKPPGRTVIRPRQQQPLPATWDRLPAVDQVADVYKFSEVVWGRQEAGLATGQRALRGMVLPSGFEIKDGLHAELVSILEDAGAVRRMGKGWRLEARPAVVRKLVTAEEGW